MTPQQARKEHQCSLCLEPIKAGTLYACDRDSWTYKAHVVCDEFWRTECRDVCDGDLRIAGEEFRAYLATWQRLRGGTGDGKDPD